MKEKYKISYNFFKFLLLPIFKFYYKPKLINEEVIPSSGPIIFCGNHIHLMDQCLVIMSTKRMVHYLAKKEYFEGKFSWFFKIVGCIPVNRNIKDENAKSLAKEVLDNGFALGIFPEGTRNKTNNILLPFKFGAVSLAKKTNATIIPFAITGNYKFRSKNLKIEYGTPFQVGNMDLEKANQKLSNEIKIIIEKSLLL